MAICTFFKQLSVVKRVFASVVLDESHPMARPSNIPRPAAQSVAPPCVLLTGFDAFGGAEVNPSGQAVQALHGLVIEGHRLVAAVLPTEFCTALTRLDALLEKHHPALVICVGQARRPCLSMERIAINVNDARIADNAGQSPIDTPIVAGGPAAYFSSLPIKAMFSAVSDAGLVAEVSQTAGTFVCNHVFYGLMHRLATQAALKHTRGGFVHVPALPEQVSEPGVAAGMPLADIVQGLRVAVTAALTHHTDMARTAGALD